MPKAACRGARAMATWIVLQLGLATTWPGGGSVPALISGSPNWVDSDA